MTYDPCADSVPGTVVSDVENQTLFLVSTGTVDLHRTLKKTKEEKLIFPSYSSNKFLELPKSLYLSTEIPFDYRSINKETNVL